MALTSPRTPQQSLELLKEGNARFLNQSNERANRGAEGFLAGLSGGQNPFAVVVGCADSRVPVEVAFDQAPGDLFVVRVAGNIVTPTQAGSVEFAVESFDCPLVVVLGHSCCGAVQAALSDLEKPIEGISENLREILETIKPAVSGLGADQLEEAIAANVEQSVQALKAGRLAERVENGSLQVIGAEYLLESGEVKFN